MATNNRRVVQGGTVLTLDPARPEPFVGDIVIDGDVITSIDEAANPESDETSTPVSADTEVIDARGCVVIPGFVDSHRHMWEAVLRGSEAHSTLDDYFGRFLGEVGPRITARDVYVGTALSAHAALLSGITTVQDVANIQDSREHTDGSAQALLDVGVRAVFSYGLSLPRIYAEGSALPADEARHAYDRLHAPGGLTTMSLVTEWGTDEQELANVALADELGIRTTRHISGGYPVSRLDAIGAMRAGTTFIHGNGLTTADLELIADAGANLSIAPAIEQMMGHGTPLAGRTPTGLLVSLSTDVEITVAADMFTQMRAAFQTARLQQHSADEADGVTVRDVLAMATRDGAQALGLGDRTGTLTPGKQADIVVLRADRADVAPLLDPYSTVVLQMDRSHVDTVLVAGRTVVRRGDGVGDDSALLHEASRVARRVLATESTATA